MPCTQQPTHISVTQRAWLTAPEKMHRCLHKVSWKSLLLVQISMFASMMQTVILQMPAPEIFRGLANPSDLADQEADQWMHSWTSWLRSNLSIASTWTNVVFGRGVSCQCMVRWRIALQENQARVGEMVIKHNTLFLGRAHNIQTATDVILRYFESICFIWELYILNYDFLQTNQASPATLTGTVKAWHWHTSLFIYPIQHMQVLRDRPIHIFLRTMMYDIDNPAIKLSYQQKA